MSVERIAFRFPAGRRAPRGRARVGAVASGNLEILLEPAARAQCRIRIRTSAGGHRQEWRAVLKRFFERHDVAADIEINDAGASPPVVMLRLEQALEEAGRDCER